MKKIESLSPEHIAAMPKYVEKWLKIGLSTEPLDFDAAKTAVIAVYGVAGLPSPKAFYRFQSPLSAAIGAVALKNLAEPQLVNQVGAQVWYQVRAQVLGQVGAQVRDQVGNQVWNQVRDQVGNQVWNQVWDQVWDQVLGQVGAQMYGSHDAGWLSFYDYMGGLGIDVSRLTPLMELARHCGWWAPYADAAILQDRPSVIKMDERNLLHCEDGPAIAYRDGFAVYAWHGVRIPSPWIENRGSLTAADALTHENMEQRRAACEIIGWARILNELDAKTVQKDSDPEIGELIEVDIPDIGQEKFLRVQCGTKREFAIPVPPEMQTALEANAWTYGLSTTDYKPEVRT